MAEEGVLVVAAMSGGVDSSVAAALLVEQGYQVVGFMLRLWAEEGPGANRCCTPDAVTDAARVADQLDIPFFVHDYREFFKQAVVDYFSDSYGRGLTPNPCLVCNEIVRFGRMLDQALTLGARYMATGHYVRRRQTQTDEYQILKGIDPTKDQSYVLQRLTQENLRNVLFPLGDYHKRDVRRMAAERKLPVSDRPDSQDLCFVGEGDYRDFLMRHVPEAVQPGPILDTAGRQLGRHRGIAFYTIGQRKGLGIAAPQPLYVNELDPIHNTVVVGTAEELGRSCLTAGQVNYLSGRAVTRPTQVTSKIRYKATEVPSTLTPLSSDRVQIEFDRPLRDITPGQGVAFYSGEVLLGGGLIEPGDSNR